MKIEIFKLRDDVEIPQFETAGSVGFDLRAAQKCEIAPGEIKLIPTGLVIKTPPGFALILASRSSTPKKKGLKMPHGIGVIDQDYCGPNDEIKIQVYNFSDQKTVVEKGDRIAQGIFVRAERCKFHEITKNENKTRGGFGSTG